MLGPHALGQLRPSHVSGVGTVPLRQFGSPRTVGHSFGVMGAGAAFLCLQTGPTLASASVLKEKALHAASEQQEAAQSWIVAPAGSCTCL